MYNLGVNLLLLDTRELRFGLRLLKAESGNMHRNLKEFLENNAKHNFAVLASF